METGNAEQTAEGHKVRATEMPWGGTPKPRAGHVQMSWGGACSTDPRSSGARASAAGGTGREGRKSGLEEGP